MMNKINFSRRTKLTVAYGASMIGLSLLNILLNVLPLQLSNNSLNTLFSLLSQIFCMGLLPFVLSVLLTKEKSESIPDASKRLMTDFGYTKGIKPIQWLILIPMTVSFYLLTRLMSTITVFFLLIFDFQIPVSAGTIYQGPLDLVKWIAITALLPAIFEEFSHRGLAMNAMKDRGNEATQVFLSALLFALMHTNVIQCFYAFVGGCIFGYIAMRSHSIYPSMVLHFANNAFACIEEYSSQYPNSIFGFIETINDFWSKNIGTSYLFIAVLVLNAVLFVYLFTMFIKTGEQREAVTSVSFSNYAMVLQKRKLQKKNIAIPEMAAQQQKHKPKYEIDIDIFRPDGKSMLVDNFVLYGVITMCGLMTLFTFVWGILR